MKIITGLTEQPKQQSTLILADGTRAVWSLSYVPQQAGWFYDLTWNGTAIATGQRLVSSPNILRQYINRISFGIAVISPNQLEPTTQTTFVDGTMTCYLLEGADLQSVETDLFDAPPGQVLPEVTTPSGDVIPVPPGDWGPAGGDLRYNYPNPQVVAMHEGGGQRLQIEAISDGQFLKRVGDTVVGAAVAPGSGDVVGPGVSVIGHVALFNSVTGDLLADGGELGTAAFSDATDFTTVNAAMSGDLGGTLPSPTVLAVHTGATKLTIGSISDGEFVKRVGTTLVGFVPSGAGDVVGPASSVNGTMALFDGVTGKLLKEGLVPGTMAGQNSNSVSISGGGMSGVAVVGGTASGVATTGGSITGTTFVGGSIDGTPIGGVTRDFGNFTTVDVTGTIYATTGDFDGIAINPFAISSPATGVLRFQGISAVNTLQGYDGTNAYGITLYDGATPSVILQSNGVSYFVGGISATTVAGNASAATSKPAVTGSVLRSFASRAGDVFNVKDYGATGDGTTDDTAAIQAADTAAVAARGVVLFPTGTFKTISSFTLASPCVFDGGALTIASATRVDFALAVQAPLHRIFFGLGKVRMLFSGARCPVEWWGAGFQAASGDDSPYIQAAVDACRFYGAAIAVVVLSGNYYLRTVITVASNCVFDNSGDATLRPSTTTPDNKGIYFSGFWDSNKSLHLPNFTGFLVYALRVEINVAHFRIGLIDGVSRAGDGICVGCNTLGSASLDNVFDVGFIANCKSAIRIYSNVNRDSGSLATIEGNEFNVNFINQCDNGVVFDSLDDYTLPVAAYTKGSAWDCNLFNITALDAGAGARRGFWYRATGTQYSQNVFRVPAWFGGFDSSGIWIDADTVTKCTFEMGVRSGEQMTSYSMFKLRGNANVVTINGSGNAFGDQLTTDIFNAVTTTNSRASFNGGTPVPRNRIRLNCPLPAPVANGAVQYFYAYSPLLDGRSNRLRIEFVNAAGFIVDSLQDNSLTYANEVYLALRNVSGSTVASGTVIELWLEVAY